MLGVLCLAVLAPSARTPAIILTYHDVIARRGPGSLWFDCTTNELEQQLDWMTRNGAHFVTLSQIEGQVIRREKLPEHAVAITFADNYRGFWLRAYPVLKRRRIPCAMFVHTGFVGSPIGRPKMTWDELRRLDREGLVTVSSQSVTHRSMAGLPQRELAVEATQSKRDLEGHLRHSIRYFAYPNGSLSSAAETAVAAAGYALAFSEVQAPVGQGDRPMATNRYVHTKWRRAWRDASALRR